MTNGLFRIGVTPVGLSNASQSFMEQDSGSPQRHGEHRSSLIAQLAALGLAVLAWRVKLSALDDEGGDQVVWVHSDSPWQIIRVEGRLPPQMGGAEFTTELTATE